MQENSIGYIIDCAFTENKGEEDIIFEIQTIGDSTVSTLSDISNSESVKQAKQENENIFNTLYQGKSYQYYNHRPLWTPKGKVDIIYKYTNTNNNSGLNLITNNDYEKETFRESIASGATNINLSYNSINGKVDQRLFLLTHNLGKYSPIFKIYSIQENSEEKIEQIIADIKTSFNTSLYPQVIIKKNDAAEGKGNLFVNLENTQDIQKAKNFIENIPLNEPFVVEELKPISSKKYKGYYKNTRVAFVYSGFPQPSYNIIHIYIFHCPTPNLHDNSKPVYVEYGYSQPEQLINHTLDGENRVPIAWDVKHLPKKMVKDMQGLAANLYNLDIPTFAKQVNELSHAVFYNQSTRALVVKAIAKRINPAIYHISNQDQLDFRRQVIEVCAKFEEKEYFSALSNDLIEDENIPYNANSA